MKGGDLIKEMPVNSVYVTHSCIVVHSIIIYSVYIKRHINVHHFV